MNPLNLQPEDAQEIFWGRMPVTLSDGRVVAEMQRQFSHQSRWYTYELCAIRFEGEEQFYGFFRETGSTEEQDTTWPDGPVELRPVTKVMVPWWGFAEEPMQ